MKTAMKRTLAMIMGIVLIISCIPAITISASTDDYRAWAQGDSRWGYLPLGASSVTVASHGCLATSVAKLIIQADLRDADSFNVGTFVSWMNNNSGFTSSGDMYWGAPSAFGLTNYGNLLSYGTYSSSNYNAQLLSWINAGYHLILGVNGCGHYIAVDEAKSIATGQIYIMDSLSNSANADITLSSRYSTFNLVHAYKGGTTPSGYAPGKPVLNHAISGNTVTLTWDETENTTHYNLWLDKLNDDGEWEAVEQIFYAESGEYRELEDGEYRAQLLSYNSNAWESDGSDWVHTWADDVFFTVDHEKWITIYDADGRGVVSNTYGNTFTLPTNYATCEGSYFSGWSYEQGAEFYDVRPGETIEVTEDISLYPVYVTHEQAVSGNLVLIYNIEDFPQSGYNIQAVDTTLNRLVNTSYWTDWSAYSTTEVSASDTVEVRTTTMYRYYYFLCPSCGAHEPFWGTSDCGATIPSDAWHVGWFTIPYTQSNYQTYSYTTAKYYTTSLGDGQIWHFSSGNLYDTAPGTVDAGGDTVVIATGYSSRDYVEQYETISEPVTAYKITEAKAGDNLTWTLDDNGTLTISGTGAMTDYSGNNDAPWCNLRASINKVVVEEGVTSIGNWAFSDCTSLTDVIIPDSVTTIGNRAFLGCTGLTDITIPDSVSCIEDYAFAECRGLTSITIPDSVTSLGNDAFICCDSLTNVSIGNGVTSIGDWAFGACASLTSIIIPDSVISIGTKAFDYCAGLTNVTYCGTAEQWNAIEIASGNQHLTGAQRSYHTYSDDADTSCNVCGETRILTDANLVFVSDPGLSFQDYIGLQVMFKNSTASDYDSFYVEITQVGFEETATATSTGIPYGSSYTIFEQQILSWSMTEQVTMTLYGVKDGVLYQGASFTTSVMEMAMEKIASYYEAVDLARCKALVDMLNYGAAVQTAYGYNAENLPNAELGKYAALGTTADPAINASNNIVGTGSIKVYANNISLQDKVEFQLMVKTSALEGKTVVATLDGSAVGVVYEEYSSYTIIRVAAAAAHMRDTYTIVVNDADGNAVTPVYNVSVEAYAKSQLESEKAAALIAMMKYGDSVAAI